MPPAGALPAAFERRYALGPSLGQCCGGAVVLAFAPLTSGLLASWPDEPPLFHLQLYGAGHVGRELVHLLSRHLVDIDWIDERGDLFPPPAVTTAGLPDSPARIRQMAVDVVQAVVALARAGAL